ncbi:GH3 auxin-responsive promoter family protein [Marinilongibacter aquaticus]|uniref:GH3 auxin-responsive promoter family protein n=1 Tax=Marinilongibacter aquaticus TaxID=2975157 RepID=UPI0021BD2DFF|nr:GH3 auxin-responsive promoter family protein [Marinilongibacter aquaticus]UBM60086.1 GH3 auxin-responsive promoter family protein [Marinilongibacter aquaticus]
MSILNDILSFFIKRRVERIDEFKINPHDTQLLEFKSLIYKARKTDYGKRFGFGDIESVSDFQAQVPIVNYESLYPEIERVLKGEPNVLWPSPIRHFSKSSGTTNAKSKYIPVSEESLESCHYKGGKDMLTLYLAENPESGIFDGKGLSIGGSLQTNPFNDKTLVGDISALIMQNLPSWAEYLRTPPLEVALLENWDEKMVKMIEICSQEKLTSILGVPTWTVVLLEQILKETGKSNLLEIWPEFELFVHGAVNFQPYRELFQKTFFPSEQVNYLEIYNASEGYFGVQDDLSRVGEMLLMLDYGVYYEFIPMEELHKEHPKALTLDEVELHKNYALVISTNAGLWRYKIGDTVKFTSKYPYRIKISGRTKHFINAFGEELIIENAETAITLACEATGAVVKDFTAGPIYMNDSRKGGHEWIIECSTKPSTADDFMRMLDETLRKINSDYDAKRKGDLALQMPKVHFVQEGTFYHWMDKRGKLGGQNKVPRLSNNREFLDDLLQFMSQFSQ